MRLPMFRVACCALLLLVACESQQPDYIDPINVDYDGDNLLSLAHGASVVSRTAELTLEASAVHAVDGDWATFWKSPPGGPEQSLVFSLPARSRIDELGYLGSDDKREVPEEVHFEASDDGVKWRDAGTVYIEPKLGPQLAPVPPFDARYLRVRIIDHSHKYYSVANSLVAKGRELSPPARPNVAGCWTINGRPAQFIERGSSVTGVIADDPPILFSGGNDGRALRLMWSRGGSWGYTIITTDPQQRTLSGLRWHEEVRYMQASDGWFGARAACTGIAIDEIDTAAEVLRRARKWSIYSSEAFDTAAALIRRLPKQRFIVVVHDQARIESARNALKARGADLSRLEFMFFPIRPYKEPQRVIADAVELHLR